MKWRKHGLVFGPDGSLPWAKHTCLTPTPVLLGDIIRVYASFRDAEGIGRIGYVDVAADNPSKVIAVSKQPVLDIGVAGCFDDNGMILGDVVHFGDTLRMYYVGFQKVARAKFIAFSGLAISTDHGQSFQRYRQTPIMDRSDEGRFIRAIHNVIPENGAWRVWYSVDDGWEPIGNNVYPRYHIRHQISPDGLTFADRGDVSLVGQGAEYRLGRG
ncbi:MAG: hypothetical protein VW600_16220, partial [Ferrovibrio sp.]